MANLSEKTIVDDLIAHKKRHGYSTALVAYESNKKISATTLSALLSGKIPPSENSVKVISNFIRQYNDDIRMIKNYKQDSLLLQPIRIFHLGEKFEKWLQRSGIETIQDLVVKTEKEFIELTDVGLKQLRIIIEKLNQVGLTFGMAINDNEKDKVEQILEILGRGTPVQIQTAIHGIARYARTQLDMDDIDLRLTTRYLRPSKRHKPFLTVRKEEIQEKEEKQEKQEKQEKNGRGQKNGKEITATNKKAKPKGNTTSNRYPIRLSFLVQVDDKKMEVINRKFRRFEDVCKLIDELVDALRPIKSVKDYEKSDVWIYKF